MLLLALKGTLVLAIGFALAAAMRRRSAASRHALWTTVCSALLVLPLAAAALPEWRVLPLPAVLSGPAPHAAAESSAPAGGASVQVTPGASGPAGAWSPAAAALGIWWLGIVACLARLGAGWLGTRRLERSTRDIPQDHPAWAAVADARVSLGVKRPVRWLMAAGDVMPVTWGVVRPCVLLPEASRRWTPARLHAVVIHEAAHVARHDAASHLVASLATAIWWWHPLAWLASRRARLERELACDDLVLSAGTRASDYAADLVAFVAALQPSMVRSPATLAMARPSQLEKRVMAILDGGIDRRGVSRAGVLAALLVTMTVWPVAAAGPAGRDRAVRQDPVQTVPPPPTGPVRIGGDIREPKKIKDVRPVYPEAAIAAGMQGIVILEAVIDTEGYVTEAKVIRSIGEPLDSAAADAVMQWRFMPTELAGSPVEVRMTVTVNFRLDQNGRPEVAPPVTRPAPEPQAAPAEPVNWSPGDPPLRVGGAVREPMKIKDVKPVYPPEALAANVAGIVILEVQINELGEVDDARVLRSVALLDEAARDAVLQWRFTPTLVNGVPVPIVMTVTVNFTPRGSRP